eukprot:CAMPEP_0175093256 /NCGR_PEP_ID=MMETSP0086_2-20121207/2909_1 /TAXON_ID=136419 /ORGANISM="Unknown Unknown, Strain D1" /LENGTH=1538 /DNA_ID=CAMNT_0016366193 /DNA_START=38 /DNA_END=4654 /DNA_ORIENTATION=+
MSDDVQDQIYDGQLHDGDRESYEYEDPDEVAAMAQAQSTARRAAKDGDREVTLVGADRNLNMGGKDYRNNMVITSKYTWWNFLPKNIFEQFSNLANIYFLLIGVLQTIPQSTTTSGVPTMYFPLAFILGVSAIRAIVEDAAIHKQDGARNGYKYDCLTSSGFKPCSAGKIRVGYIVKVKEDEMFPADMIFLASAYDKGHAFIDKANLNGETTLEVVTSVHDTRKFFVIQDDPNPPPPPPPGDEDAEEAPVDDGNAVEAIEDDLDEVHTGAEDFSKLMELNLTIKYEAPNKKFDSFHGQMSVDGQDYHTVDKKCLLMRETNLRNTPFVYGLVVYTGNDTKIQRSNLESGKPRTKQSALMIKVRTLLLGLLLWLSIMCLGGAAMAAIWQSSNENKHTYLGFEITDVKVVEVGLYAFFSWMILLSQIVPISLIVSMEMVKFAQGKFIQWDADMYHGVINRRTRVNNSTIHEDLGLIDYVFSDKTGTLTQNKMEFRHCLMDHGEYGSKDTEIAKAVRNRAEELARKMNKHNNQAPPVEHSFSDLNGALQIPEQDDIKPECCQSCCCGCWWGKKPSRDEVDVEDKGPLPCNEFSDEERLHMLQALWGSKKDKTPRAVSPADKEMLQRYMLHMALSNTVKPYYDGDELKFQAESAEELAMVKFAQSCGFTKKGQNPTVVEILPYSITSDGHPVPMPEKTSTRTFNHIATCSFTSQRARVSLIYQQVGGFPNAKAKQNPIHVMLKGSDTVVLPLLHKPDNKDQAEYDKHCNELHDEISGLAANGLRVLVVGWAELPASWWTQERRDGYAKVIHADGDDVEDAEFEEKFFEDLETDAKIEYLGCMGLEDQLQKLVPETISDFLKAGIKVWMITGDKLETAKNIGLACNLVDSDMLPKPYHPGEHPKVLMESAHKSRLLEITGQWAEVGADNESMNRMFDLFDVSHSGSLDKEELKYCFQALDLHVPMEQVSHILGGDLSCTREQFISLFAERVLSPLAIIENDIDRAIERYAKIPDHDMYPISLLVNRTAFQTLFPGKDVVYKGAMLKQLKHVRDKFFLLASVSKSVIFARAQPAMKKRMVTEIMERVPKARCLAVGDGANDTDMIQAAHVGVGISGVEGTAAMTASDYAIGTFRMLHTLVFVHGFWSYHRVSNLILFIFYKATLLAGVNFYYGFYSGFSGQQFYNDPLYLLYNVVFTSLPIIFTSILDQPLPRDVLENNPEAFRAAKRTRFTVLSFIGWIGRGIVHGLIVFMVPLLAFRTNPAIDDSGRDQGLWYVSTIVIYLVAIVPNIMIFYMTNNITVLHYLGLFLSGGGLFVLGAFLQLDLDLILSVNSDLYGYANVFHTNIKTILILIVGSASPFLIEMVIKLFQYNSYLTMTQVLRESHYLREVMRKGVCCGCGKGKKKKQRFHMVTTIDEEGNEVTTQEPVEEEEEEEDGKPKKQAVIIPKNKKDPLIKNMEQLHTLAEQIQAGKVETTGMEEEGEEPYVHEPSDRLRENLVQAMLSFGRLTGGQFDSVATAQFQAHDSIAKKGPRRPGLPPGGRRQR